ncbi:hypothetical protein [Mucilaginibacter sp. L3T2-6]|uniref:hypothetical protein n=1 Tax=Mucilaginibacter sp. L3T2-6 TaxID=3062491 RepID=UPI002676962C|nr:hypothetical protein [Mucilaginibacter sp. L3T2-6]MDO3642576.1 hypothetical protein [Mucilaginibacter sp. L3T2-6]MDV6215028.1 hypothetical protein [Mucilaginibacter sp. L3T2-6]
MDDQLDNDLKNHIREVFDNYEDTTADEGWLLLREKFPVAKRRNSMIWLWRAAAILLLCCGIGVWLKISTDKPLNPVVRKVNRPLKQSGEQVKRVAPDTLNSNSIAAKTPDKFTHQRIAAAIAETGKTLHTNSQNPAEAGNKQIGSVSDRINKDNQVQSTQTDKQLLTNNQMPIPLANKQLNLNTGAIAQTTTPAGQQTTTAPSAPTSTATTSINTLAAQQPKQQKDIMDMFKHDQGNKQAVKDENQSKEKKVNFGLYAGTYFNYGKGSDNQVNVGGGITSDIKLNRNLKLVTGISIAQNSLSYQAIPTVAASLKSSLAVPAAIQSGNMYATLASTPTIKNYNASLVGLDIPINLKYEFNPDKTDAYVSLGLSSGTFIDESYTYKYNYPSFQSSSLKETRNETTGNNFNSFYFAKTLNVAFGVGYPFGKNRLVIEPFLKYPLDGLGSQNLKFGAGGLNLKFNFLPSRK